MAEEQCPVGVLMVGSVPLDKTEEVFTKLCNSLPQRLLTIPDGECGERSNYISWQTTKFPPETRRFMFGGTPGSEADKAAYTLDSIQPTQYDVVALSSYAEFVRLRDKGIIPSETRFQLCLPTPIIPVSMCCKPEFHAELEPLYEKRFEQSLKRIFEHIPHRDMVIQWDAAFEVLALEYDCGRLANDWVKPHFTPVKAGLIERLARVCQLVPQDVNIAFHLCYGDANHKHIVEPVDTSLMVDLANDFIHTVGKTHRIEWFHMPVPRDRTDAAYFEPLNKLRLDDIRLYLGLVHANDEAGTRERIKTAQATIPFKFGVATECGLGRTPREEIDSILDISRSVTLPVR